MGQVTVFSGIERRRRWTEEQKRALVTAAFSPGAVAAEVARAADVHTGQLYRWRKEFAAGAERVGSRFAEMVVAPEVARAGPTPAIQIRLGRITVDVGGDASERLVTATLRALAR